MKEVLFRGQTRRFGEMLMNVRADPMPSNWAYGGICQGKGDFSIIYGDLNEERENPIDKFVVYTDTVGMYVGTKDIDDKHIFEGDICEDSMGVRFTVEWDADNTRFIGRTVGGFNNAGYPVEAQRIVYVGKEPRVKIIGNIYDNPELILTESKMGVSNETIKHSKNT